MENCHRHLIVNAKINNPPTDPELMCDWFNELVAAVGMRVLIPPSCTFSDNPGNEGLTGTVCIDTSHASIHVWHMVEEPYLRFDLYSCREFDPMIVIEMLDRFGIRHYDSLLIGRDNGIDILQTQSVTNAMLS